MYPGKTSLLFISFLVIALFLPLRADAQYQMAKLSCEPENPDSAIQCVCNPKLLPSGKYQMAVRNKVMRGIRVGDRAGRVANVTVKNCGREIIIPGWPGGPLKLVATKLEDDIPVRFQGYHPGSGGAPASDWDFAVVTGSVQTTGTNLTVPARAELNGVVKFIRGSVVIHAQSKITLLNPFEETIEETLIGDQGTAKVNRKCECAKLKRFRERIQIYRDAWLSDSIYQRIKAGGLAHSNPGVPYMDFDRKIHFPPDYQAYKDGKITMEELRGKHGTYQQEISKYTKQRKEEAAKGRCDTDIFPSGGASTDGTTCKINLDAAGLFAAGIPAAGIRSMWMHEKVHQKHCFELQNLSASDRTLARNSPERIRAEDLEATKVQLDYMDDWAERHCKKN